MPRDQFGEPGFVERHPAFPQLGDLVRVGVDTDHLETQLGHRGGVGCAEIARADHTQARSGCDELGELVDGGRGVVDVGGQFLHGAPSFHLAGMRVKWSSGLVMPVMNADNESGPGVDAPVVRRTHSLDIAGDGEVEPREPDDVAVLGFGEAVEERRDPGRLMAAGLGRADFGEDDRLLRQVAQLVEARREGVVEAEVVVGLVRRAQVSGEPDPVDVVVARVQRGQETGDLVA